MVVRLSDPARTVFNRVPEQFRPDPEMTVKVGEDKLVLVSVAMEDGSPRFPVDGKAVPFLQYTPECSLAWAIEDLLTERHDLSLQRLSTNPFADGLRLMVAGGVGVAWLPESLISRELASGTMVRASDESASTFRSISWSSGPPIACRCAPSRSGRVLAATDMSSPTRCPIVCAPSSEDRRFDEATGAADAQDVRTPGRPNSVRMCSHAARSPRNLSRLPRLRYPRLLDGAGTQEEGRHDHGR